MIHYVLKSRYLSGEEMQEIIAGESNSVENGDTYNSMESQIRCYIPYLK